MAWRICGLRWFGFLGRGDGRRLNSMPSKKAVFLNRFWRCFGVGAWVLHLMIRNGGKKENPPPIS
jgi:hypothetical protein